MAIVPIASMLVVKKQRSFKRLRGVNELSYLAGPIFFDEFLW